MAGIKDVNFIFDTMRQKNLPYWKAYLGSDPLSSYDEGNVEDSIVTLKKLLEAIENQTVRIVVRPKTSKDLGAGGDTKTNVFTYYFETKNLNPNSNYNNSAPVINGLNDETVDRMIQQAKEIERLNHQIELNKLQHQINEIKRSKELEENEDEEEGIGS